MPAQQIAGMRLKTVWVAKSQNIIQTLLGKKKC